MIIIDHDLLPQYEGLTFHDKNGKQIFRYSENITEENENVRAGKS